MATKIEHISRNGRRSPAGVGGDLGATPAATSRRRPWIALASLLLPLSALTGVIVVQQLGHRIQALQAARDIEAGQVISSADFRVVDVAVDGTAELVSAADRDRIVGLTASARIPSGSLVSPADFAAGVGLPEGTVVVGAVLAPGELPTSDLRVGDHVRLVQVSAQSGEENSVLGDAEVFAVSSPDVNALSGQGSTGSVFVSLAVTEKLAPAVAQATSGQHLRLIYLPAGGGGR